MGTAVYGWVVTRRAGDKGFGGGTGQSAVLQKCNQHAVQFVTIITIVEHTFPGVKSACTKVFIGN